MNRSFDNKDVSVPRRSWMVEFDLPVPITAEFAALIPSQRLAVGMMLSAGTLLSYTLNAERSKLWAVMLASSEDDLRRTLSDFPILSYTRFRVHELFFHETAQTGVTRMSLN